jgi:hypothetical protein
VNYHLNIVMLQSVFGGKKNHHTKHRSRQIQPSYTSYLIVLHGIGGIGCVPDRSWRQLRSVPRVRVRGLLCAAIWCLFPAMLWILGCANPWSPCLCHSIACYLRWLCTRSGYKITGLIFFVDSLWPWQQRAEWHISLSSPLHLPCPFQQCGSSHCLNGTV